MYIISLGILCGVFAFNFAFLTTRDYAWVESTLVYTQLIGFESDEFHSAVAETIEEARKLVEDGFEYVCQKDEIMLFRKRK